jgi:Sec-independent protein translocase protein TatA
MLGGIGGTELIVIFMVILVFLEPIKFLSWHVVSVRA